ncbi:hypothetical protein [Knoellia locipacati]|nr:hypothetical protein [Knoellia locipacati]
MSTSTSIRTWLLLAVVAVMVQEALTVYSAEQGFQHAFWGGISLFLLYRVYRGGDVARRIFLVVSVIGTGVLLGAPWRSGGAVDVARVALLFVSYLVQSGVMLVPAVRHWTRQQRQAMPSPVPVG